MIFIMNLIDIQKIITLGIINRDGIEFNGLNKYFKKLTNS
jgi:hypothetical protein